MYYSGTGYRLAADSQFFPVGTVAYAIAAAIRLLQRIMPMIQPELI